MTASNRSAQYTTLFKALKKAGFEAPSANPDRPVLTQILFATCLENASHEAAEEAFAALENNFIDWNEVRVTTVRELSESLRSLPDAEATADRIRRILQSVFEATYGFDMEPLRKLNLNPAIEELKKIDGASPFVVSYVTQSALGGHSIPIDQSAARAFFLLGFVSAKQAEAISVPGLERAIPKNQGAEFSAMLHQFATRFEPHTSDPAVLSVVKAVAPQVLAEWGAKEAAAGSPPAAGGKKAPARKRGSKAASSEAPVEAPPAEPSVKSGAKAKVEPDEQPAPETPSAGGKKTRTAPQKAAGEQKEPRKKAVAPRKKPQEKKDAVAPPGDQEKKSVAADKASKKKPR